MSHKKAQNAQNCLWLVLVMFLAATVVAQDSLALAPEPRTADLHPGHESIRQGNTCLHRRRIDRVPAQHDPLRRLSRSRWPWQTRRWCKSLERDVGVSNQALRIEARQWQATSALH